MTINARSFIATLVSCVMLGVGTGATAQVPPANIPKDVVHLAASAEALVLPDRAVIQLVVDRSGPDAATLATEVNTIMAEAVRRAQGTAGVEAVTSGYTTHPTYDKKSGPNGWRVRAELTLRGRDFAVLGKLAGSLSKSLIVVASRFEWSDAERSKIEQQLVGDAIRAFRRKADDVAKAFGYRTADLREVHIGALEGDTPRPSPMMKVSSSLAEEAAPMPIAAGASTLRVTINGAVTLVR
jgi:predicted secreted protein